MVTRIILVLCFLTLIVTGHALREQTAWHLGVMAAAGLFMVLVAIWGRIWCTLYIGGRKDRCLVTEGPYARCRNPLYFFSWTGAIGIAAATGSLTLLLLVLWAFPVAYHFVIRGEEKKLALLHGQAFADYCAAVPRFWPALGGHKDSEPGMQEYSSKLFHKTSRDTFWFVVAWFAVTLINFLHHVDRLPDWWRLL